MTRAFEQRVLRALATTNNAMARSQFVIWCHEPKHMPAMIDLLIAQGRLTESDRPHCVHWKALKHARELTDEDAAKMGDADDMLVAAGIPTFATDGWNVLELGIEEFDDFLHDRLGCRLEPDERTLLEKVAAKARMPWAVPT